MVHRCIGKFSISSMDLLLRAQLIILPRYTL